MFRRLWALLTRGVCVELYDSLDRKTIPSIAYQRRLYNKDFSHETALVAHVYWATGVGNVVLHPDGSTDERTSIRSWRRDRCIWSGNAN